MYARLARFSGVDRGDQPGARRAPEGVRSRRWARAISRRACPSRRRPSCGTTSSACWRSRDPVTTSCRSSSPRPRTGMRAVDRGARTACRRPAATAIGAASRRTRCCVDAAPVLTAGGARPALARDTCGVRATVTALACAGLAVGGARLRDVRPGAGGRRDGRGRAARDALGGRRRRRAAPRPQPRGVRAPAARPTASLYLGDVYETGTATRVPHRLRRALGSARAAHDPDAGQPRVGQPRHRLPALLARAARAARCPTGSACALGAGWELLSLNSEAPHGAGLRAAALARARDAGGPGPAGSRSGTARASAAAGTATSRDMAPLWNALRGHARIVLSGPRPRPAALRRPRRAAPDRLGRRRPAEHPAPARLARDGPLRQPARRRAARGCASRAAARRSSSCPAAAACWTAAP